MSAPVPAPDDPTPIDPVTEPWRPGDGNQDKPNPAQGEDSDDGDEQEDEDGEDEPD